VAGGRTAVGTGVVLQRCNFSGQDWQARAGGHLVDPRSGLCLTDPGGGRSGTQLDLARCAGTAAQQWKLP